VLRQKRDGQPASLRHLSRIGDLLAGEDAEQRRLATAVRADHAHADAWLDVEVEPVEDQPRAEALRETTCLQQ
jgi:hypothetical protein